MTLIAWLNGDPVAELNDAGQGYMSLRYTEEAVRQHGQGSILLSLKLPVRAAPYPGTEAKYFLDGLLPEDHVRAALADRARVSAEDTYGLLKAYGLDCAGAIQVTEPDQGPGTRQGGVHWLDGSDLKKAISDLPGAPLGIDVDPGVRSSLGGLQGKLAVVLDGERVGLPVNGALSTHILKPARLTDEGIERWPGIAAAEHFAMRLTLLAGQSKGMKVRAAETEVRDIMGRSAILVRRFDRRGNGKSLRRIHQEDFGQSLGITEKYQNNSYEMPRLVDIAQLLVQHSTGIAMQPLLERLTLGTILGDCDAHVRNHAVLLEDGRVELSPAYDVVPTATWADHSRELALRISGEVFIDDVRGKNLVEEAMSWGMRRPAATMIIRRSLEAASALMPVLLAESKDQGWYHPVLDDVIRGAEERLRALTPG